MSNLFEMFGMEDAIAKEIAEKEKKEEKKQTTRKTSKSGTKGKKYKLPLEVITGYREPFMLNGDGEVELTLSELSRRLGESLSIPNKLLDVVVEKEKVYVAFSSKNFIKKGNVCVDSDTEIVFPSGETGPSLSSIITSEKEEISVEQIQSFVSEYDIAYKAGINLLQSDNVLYIVPDGDLKGKHKFPLQIHVIGRETMLLTKEEYFSFCKKETFEQESIKNYIISKYPEYTGHLDIMAHDSNITAIFCVKKPPIKPQQEFYPTDIKLYLMGPTPIQLTPTMFGGEEEIDQEELIKYVRENVSPIFKKERCDIQFFSEEKSLYVTMKGSKKGALLIEKKDIGDKLKERYCLFQYEKNNGESVIVEKNPTVEAVFFENMELGYVKLLHGKIPAEFIFAIDIFFQKIANMYHTEALVRIVWTPDKGYELVLPEQSVTESSVYAEPIWKKGIESIPVAEIHSHCHFPAFWSSTDNDDEKMALIYGVIGGYGKNKGMKFRSFADGKEFCIDKEKIFELEVLENLNLDYLLNLIENLIDKFKRFV